MKFKVSEEVFNKLDDVCFGGVVARGLNNNTKIEEITNLLNQSISSVEDYFNDKNEGNIIEARNELANLLKKIFDCEIEVGFIDKNNMEMKL